MRRLLSVTEERVPEAASGFDPSRAWRVHPQIALRDESFGALAYHFGTRRLMFLKSRRLVELPEGERPAYRRALARLAASEVIDVR